MPGKLPARGYLRKDVEVLTPRICLDEGIPASLRDQTLFAESLVLREALAADLFGNESALAYRRALLSMRKINARSISKDWKSIYGCLIQEEFLNTADWEIFKRSLSTYPHWMVAPLIHHMGECDCEYDFARALQWLKFDSKLSFKDTPIEPERDAYLDDEFVFGWYDRHNDESLLLELNSICQEWCHYFPDEGAPFRGYHSSGTVSGISREHSSPISKTEAFIVTPQLQEYLNFRNLGDDGLQLLTVMAYDEEDEVVYQKPVWLNWSVSSPPIDVHFVPKTPLVRRVISPEDSLHMYLQADAAEQITPWINKFHWCDLNDQQKSRDMAMRGSQTGFYATVDASKASDFVRHSQVEIILDNTPLWPYYSLTRSESARIEMEDRNTYQTISLRKAAPMGSKICFLLETLVFALCCELAVRRTLGRKSRRGDFRVYGDDVVIRVDCLYAFYLIMSMMFFKVNYEKSFYNQGKLKFREACGLYAVNGKDITPFQLSRKYPGLLNLTLKQSYRKVKKAGKVQRVRMFPFTTPDAAQALSVLDMVNRLTLAGLVNSRRWMYTVLSEGEWTKYIWRVRLQDFEEECRRISEKRPTILDCPVPTLITYDYVDANFNIDATPRRDPRTGEWTSMTRQHRLIAVTRTKKSDQGYLAYFHWSSERSKTDVGTRNARPLSDVERLTYSSPGTVVWRFDR